MPKPINCERPRGVWRSVISLCVLLMMLQSGTYQKSLDPEQLSLALNLIRQRSSPDPDRDFFDVQSQLQQGKIVLKGKVGDVSQKLLLLAGFHQFGLPVVDQVEVFPFKQPAMPYAWVATPWLDGFSVPAVQPKIKTQFLLGQLLRVLKMEGEWALVQSVNDQFLAWVHYPALLPLSVQTYQELIALDSVIVPSLAEVSLYAAADFKSAVQKIQAGTRLPLQKVDDHFFQVLLPTPQGVKTLFAARGRLKLFIPQQTVLPEKIVEEARRWLQVPYREGGTTLLGWDASAYIQHIYRQQGILLPRKAEQILSAALIIRDLSQLKPGDLFFYQNQSGLYLGQQEILHPRPEQQCFVISSLNPADPRYDKTIRISFRHAARLLLGKGY